MAHQLPELIKSNGAGGFYRPDGSPCRALLTPGTWLGSFSFNVCSLTRPTSRVGIVMSVCSPFCYSQLSEVGGSAGRTAKMIHLVNFIMAMVSKTAVKGDGTGDGTEANDSPAMAILTATAKERFTLHPDGTNLLHSFPHSFRKRVWDGGGA